MRSRAILLHRLRALPAALALLTVATPASGAQPAAGPTAPSAYRGALDAIEAGRTREGVEALRRIVAGDPGNLGAQLDLAIALCLAGEADEAGRLLLLLEARPDLPPSIAEVIALYRGEACRPPSRSLAGFAATGVGFAHNLNLASLSSRIFLPGLGVELELAESSRRRSAPFATAEVGAAYALTSDRRWTLGGHALATRFRDAGDYALTSAQATLAWSDTVGGWRSDAQASHATLRLGASGLRILSGSASALRPLGDAWALGIAGHATQLRYPELPALDARQFEARLRMRWQSPVLRLTIDGGWLEDRQTNERPGGDRRGPVIQAQAAWAPGGDRQVDATFRHGWLRDSAPYNTALFGDARRAPALSTLGITLRQRLREGLNARLEYRLSRSSDALDLFDYRAHTVSMSVEWLFGGAAP